MCCVFHSCRKSQKGKWLRSCCCALCHSIYLVLAVRCSNFLIISRENWGVCEIFSRWIVPPKPFKLDTRISLPTPNRITAKRAIPHPKTIKRKSRLRSLEEHNKHSNEQEIVIKNSWKISLLQLTSTSRWVAKEKKTLNVLFASAHTKTHRCCGGIVDDLFFSETIKTAFCTKNKWNERQTFSLEASQLMLLMKNLISHLPHPIRLILLLPHLTFSNFHVLMLLVRALTHVPRDILIRQKLMIFVRYSFNEFIFVPPLTLSSVCVLLLISRRRKRVVRMMVKWLGRSEIIRVFLPPQTAPMRPHKQHRDVSTREIRSHSSLKCVQISSDRHRFSLHPPTCCCCCESFTFLLSKERRK